MGICEKSIAESVLKFCHSIQKAQGKRARNSFSVKKKERGSFCRLDVFMPVKLVVAVCVEMCSIF